MGQPYTQLVSKYGILTAIRYWILYRHDHGDFLKQVQLFLVDEVGIISYDDKFKVFHDGLGTYFERIKG